MKINQIINETTTAGAVATVASPMGAPQRRTSEDMTVKGLQPVDKVMKGKAKKKGPYANSLVEGKMKDLAYDLEHLDSGNFVKKYGKSKDDLKAALNKQKQPQQKPVSEAELQEDDLIVIPGMSSKRKNGFVPRGQSRVDHEIEMAKSDLIQCIKNAESILDCIQDRTEDEGLEGWIQEKIIKASDYLNAVAENLESKKLEMVHPGGVIAGGGVGESKTGLKKSTLASYKKKAAAQASELDRQAFSGDDPDAKKKIEKSNKRFSGIVRATKKEFGEGVAEAEKNPFNNPLGKALYRDLSKEKKASPVQVQRNKERWAKRQAEKAQGVAEEKLDEKFKSQQQAKLMYAVAGDKGVAKKTGVSQKVAKEFVKKSHGQKVSSLPKKVAKKD